MELDLKAQKEYENRTLVKHPALFASLRSHSCVYAPHLVLSTKVPWGPPVFQGLSSSSLPFHLFIPIFPVFPYQYRHSLPFPLKSPALTPLPSAPI